MVKTYVDVPLAREVYLVGINDGNLYRQNGHPIVLNLARKKAKGTFNRQLAIKLYGYWVDNARRVYYASVHGTRLVSVWGPGKMFPMNGATKRYCAVLALRHYESEVNHYAKQFAAKVVRRRPRKKKIGLLGY